MIEKFNSFSPDSKVWIYGSNRRLSAVEVLEIQIALDAFTASWTAHEIPLMAKGAVIDEHFIILMVDENIAKVSGCGIDKSVSLVQNLSSKYSVDFFNRMQVYFEKDKELIVIPIARFSDAFASGIIREDSLMCNTLVQTKSELISNWKIKVKDSWLSKKVPSFN